MSETKQWAQLLKKMEIELIQELLSASFQVSGKTIINFEQKNKNFFIFFKKKFPDKFTNISIVHIYSQLIIFNTPVKMLCYYNFSE